VIGRIEIPAIGLSKVVLHGVRRETLRHGPGHYPGTPLPGQAGNAAIAGHRTTYGAPFHDLDRLKPGDPITVVTSEGTFDYVIEGHTSASGEQVGYVVVEPDALDVVADRGDNRLTLTACHPKHSARQRIVVTALLVDPPAGSWPAPTSTRASPTATADPARQAPLARPPIAPGGNSEASASGWTPAGDALESSYGWQRDQLPPLVLWVAVTLIIGCAGKALGQRSRSRLVNALTALVLAPALFQCFTHLDRLLPAY
jgi:sortase A